VIQEDFSGLSIKDRKKIFGVIEKKLFVNPEVFGKPLRKGLQGFYRLRVDFYRVIYSIKKKEVTVYVIKVGKRKDGGVYEEELKRL
jgi:mRNA-degrading endonuclease RelE of RelBE toxin-antitoxin system